MLRASDELVIRPKAQYLLGHGTCGGPPGQAATAHDQVGRADEL